MISLVGAGGKTTLMFALSQELASWGGLVITTTTTRILPPSPAQSPFLLFCSEEEDIVAAILQNRGKYEQFTVVAGQSLSGKLRGIAPDIVNRLSELRQVSHVIVEADGASRRPLKAPSPTEPVIPSSTSLVIPVVGIDALGCELEEKVVFRADIASRLTGIPLGRIISADTIATLITHQNGIIKGSPAQARVVPFINKVDADSRWKARGLALKILQREHPQIHRVVLGQAQSADPVLETVIKEGD